MPINEEPQWEDYKKMIKMLAARRSAQFAVERDELELEGNLIFVTASRKYRPERGAFSTFLWRCLDNGLLSFCKREKRQAWWELSDDGTLIDCGHNEHKHTKTSIFIQQSVAMLPASASNSMRLLMHAPGELGLDGSEPPKAVRGALKRHLRAQGESWSVTWQAMREIKNIFQEAI